MMIERMQIRPARSDEYQEVPDLVLRVFDLDVSLHELWQEWYSGKLYRLQ
jgi:hypothetical protein